VVKCSSLVEEVASSEGGIIMAKVCECCGRGPATGNRVSHSNRHTKRRWEVNLQSVKVDLGGNETRRMKICTRCLKSGKVKRAL